ncbi:MAG: efflux RND transporter periplasmic adaptor subunit [Vicinamibacterales bacterium]
MTRHPHHALAAAVLLVSLAACRAPADQAPAAEPEPDVSVTVTPIIRTTMHAFVDGWGRVEPEPARAGHPAANARVSSPVAGLVATVAGAEGQRVAAGTILFRLDSRVADVAVAHAQQAVTVAEQVMARQERLGPGEATSQKAYQEASGQLAIARSELAAAELQRRLLDVPAPISGTIVSMTTRTGDAIDPATVLAEIVDLDRLVVTASVRSVDAARVKPGQDAELSIGDPPGGAAGPAAAPTTATVDYIGPEVDPATDTVQVRARLPRGAALRPGQFVTVRIVAESRADRLAVPVDSVVRMDGGTAIALVSGDTATMTPVTLGITEGGLVEVSGAGVVEGGTVVVQGAYGLPATSKITVIGR